MVEMIFLPEWLFMDRNAFPVGKRRFKIYNFKNVFLCGDKTMDAFF